MRERTPKDNTNVKPFFNYKARTYRYRSELEGEIKDRAGIYGT